MTTRQSLLSRTELRKLEKRFSSWKLSSDYSKATLQLTFKRHIDAVVFIARLAIHAEVLSHHPEIHITGTKVKLTTHTEKSLTPKDEALMERIEKLLEKGG
jgi:pterin-4a-carbinolamine dehydratase